ncbi:MAG: MaoC/PaaZ C-terminal domain-containing protein [Candidatus Jordarchaeaceae archaeon]
MCGKFFEDFRVNEKFVTPARTVTETDLVLFAALTGDYNPIHTDEEFAKKNSIFKTRVLHGLYTLSISEGLIFRLGLLDGVPAASLGWNNVKFTKPVFIGDTLHLELTVVEKRESKSNPTMGVIVIHYTMKNQRDEVVMEADHALFVGKKGNYSTMKNISS